MATAQQAACFLSKRPDIKGLICSNRPDVCNQGDLAILNWWWNQVLIAPGTPDWNLKQQVGGNLDQFLANQGCLASGPIQPAPGPISGTTPQPAVICGTGQVKIPLVNACVNQWLALGGGAVVLYLLLGGGRRRR